MPLTTPTLTFGGQVRPEEVRGLAARGVRSLVCNRPDHEDPGQPTFAEVAAAARAAGIEARHIPVVPGRATEADVRAFARALAEMPGPMHAFCRSGGRAQALAQAAARLR